MTFGIACGLLGALVAVIHVILSQWVYEPFGHRFEVIWDVPFLALGSAVGLEETTSGLEWGTLEIGVNSFVCLILGALVGLLVHVFCLDEDSGRRRTALKRFKLMFLWIIVAGSFTAYGFFGPGFEGGPFDWGYALQWALDWGSLGIGIATYLVAGLYAIHRARRGSLAKWLGILLVLFSSAVGIVVPPLLMGVSGLFHGEGGLTILFQAVLSVHLGIVAFIVFTIIILCIRLEAPTKITGANAGGPRQLPKRARWASRVAQFWRSRHA